MQEDNQDSGSLPDPNDRPLKMVEDSLRKTVPDLDFKSKNADPPFTVGKESYKEIAQSLLISMQNARNIENGVTAFLPLANDETRDILLRIQGHSEQIHKLCNSIYKDIAVPAFNN